MALLTGWLEKTIAGARGSDWQLTFLERCLIAGRALWFYVRKILWPTELMFIYPKWEVDPRVAWPYLFPIGVVIQLLVACAGALLLSWLARAAEAIGSLFRRGPAAEQTTAGVRLPPRLDIPGCSPLCEALRGRAPPGLLVSLR